MDPAAIAAAFPSHLRCLVAGRAEDNGGPTYHDFSGNGLDLTIAADAGTPRMAWSAGPYGFGLKAKPGVAAANARAAWPAPGGTPTWGPTQQFTVACLFKIPPGSSAGYLHLFSAVVHAENPTIPYDRRTIYRGPSGTLVGAASPGGTQAVIDSGVSVTDNAWHLAVLTGDTTLGGTNTRLYLATAQVGSAALSGPVDSQSYDVVCLGSAVSDPSVNAQATVALGLLADSYFSPTDVAALAAMITPSTSGRRRRVICG